MKMYFNSVAISTLVYLAVTLRSAAEINNIYTCRFADDVCSEIECTLGDFNKNGSRPLRTLNIYLPNQTYLTWSMMPRIKAARFIIRAPYLESIAEDAFSGFEDSILLLKVGNGGLEEVPTALGRLHRLRTLNLDGNRIRSLSNSLKHMQSVRHLVVSKNRISSIDKLAFHSGLHAVNLMDNRIRSLNGSLAYKYSIKWLFVSRNRISLLGGELDGMESLQLLDASWNSIKDIVWASLKLPLLEILDLSHNEISLLGNGLNELHKLKMLDLSYNRLEVLEENNFLNLRNLQVLNLSKNLLRRLDERVFDCLTKLIVLDLSLNQVKEFSALLSPGSSVLKVLLLSTPPNVSEESVEEACDFRIKSSLKIVNVTGNAWKCDSVSLQSILRLQKRSVKLIGNPC